MTKPGETPTGQQNADGTQPSSDELTAKMEELDKKMAELEATKADFEARSAGLDQLQGTLTDVLDSVRQPAPAPEPAPAPPEWDPENPVAGAAEVAGRVTKAGLEQYHQAISPALSSINEGMKELEWDRVRNSDSKNFDRLKGDIDAVVKKLGYSPGVIRNVFHQLRGRKYEELKAMDVADAAKEPTPDPAPAMGSGSKHKEDKFDTLNSEELHVVRGLGTHPKEYFMRRYGREPNFEEGYVSKLGFQEETK